MGKVLKFLTREEQRIKKHLREFELHDLKGMNQMLPKGFTFNYYRFGPPTMEVKEQHHWLIQEELERRNVGQNTEVP